MARIPLPLGFSFYQSESLPFSAQRCTNWIPTVAESAALNTRALFQPLGLKEFVDSMLSANRDAQMMKEVAYFISGDTLFSVLSTGVINNHGAIEGSGRVSLANNGQYLVIVVPGGSAYAYNNVADTLNKIADTDFRTSDTVVFKDGYFVFSASDGTVFFNSALNDPFTYDALDFGSAEINPDRIVALHVNHNELFVAGSETIELFQNVGGAGFPFQRIPGANIQKGVHAKFSLIEFDNTFCFVGGGLNERSAIWKVTGSSSAQKISTDAIDKEIQKFTSEEIGNSFALTYSFNGQFLALFTFESTRIPSRTFVYNATASALMQQRVWFEFQDGVTDDRFRVQSIVSAYGKLLVGDSKTGIIGELDSDTLDYYGNEIFRQSASQPFDQGGLPIFAGEFEATFQSGVGLTVGQGSEPIVRMDKSDDGGRTFNSETRRTIGKIGEYGQRSIWRRQGRFPVSRVVRLTITDKVRANLIRLAATPEAGSQ
ncbi:MAG: hypothetical protein COB12_12730 [Flavobacterium sp.]|nr:MAG: hypothetical protein COB12_12730 [Flavobacterium sp.]